jgi:hypothetical protein
MGSAYGHGTRRHPPIRSASCRALGRDRLAGFAAAEGFADIVWLMPEETGFFQPLLAARAAAPD